MNHVSRALIASFLLISASFPAEAVAQEVAPADVPDAPVAPAAEATQPASAPGAQPTVGGTSTVVTVDPTPEVVGKPWRGSTISYGHTASAVSARRDFLPHYNPYYTHVLSLAPQWHFNQWVFLRGRLDIGQELTTADDTEYLHEVVLSDLTLDVGTSGWKEPYSGINIAGDLRFVAPTSKVAQAQTRVLSVGPRLALSRTFEVLSGLTVAYEGRYSHRFHRYSTAQYDAPRLLACVGVESIECLESSNTGRRNFREDVAHGPTLVLQPIDKLTIAGAMRFLQYWKYPLAATDLPVRENEFARERFLTSVFSLSVSYPVLEALSLTLGATTITPENDPSTGIRRNPFFNQNTTLNLDLGVDLEALLTRS